MTDPLLPDQTGDDTDIGWGDDSEDDRDDRDRADDDRLRNELPPHHLDRDR